MKRILKYFVMFSGALIFALSFNIFLRPAGIAPGGLTGISLLISFLIPQVPVGTLTLALNLPLFWLGFRKLGGEFVKNTVLTTIALSIFLDVLNFLPSFSVEPLLAAIYGGLLTGIGMGLAFLPNSSTGGIDIAIRVLKKRYPQLSLGQIMLFLDALIALSAGAVYKNLNNALYAVISMYVASITLDAILYGLNYAKAALIITENVHTVNERLLHSISRGTTLIPCSGGYSHNDKTLILCAVKRSQIPTLKAAVNAADPHAFVILTEAHEVMGLGFKNTI